MSLPTYTKTHHSTTYPSISPLLPTLSTAGKVILITGAASPIGTAAALSFAASGAKAIILLGRTASTLNASATTVREKYPSVEVITFVTSITDQEAAGKVFGEVTEKFGGVDVLVQNAGYFPDPEAIATADITEYMSAFETNVKGNLIITQAFLNSNSKPDPEKEKVIIHVTTAGVHIPAMPLPMSAYIASKTAALKMMEYLHVELQGKGVRVMMVHPGIHDTEQAVKAAKAGFVAPFDDVQLPADFIVWASSPEAKFLAGKTIWANWDVDELVARKEEIVSGTALTLGLNGWP